MKAMILAAGLGTRLKPWTDKHPKALAVVNGKSLLQRNVEYLTSFGIQDIVVNVHHFADQIIDAVRNNNGWGANIIISDETNEVLETGGGLKKAIPLFGGDETIVLMNADILTNLDLSKMISHHQQQLPLATLAITQRTSSRYFMFDDNARLCGWANDSTGEVKGVRGNKAAFSGIHVLSSAIFPLLTTNGKFSIVDVYLQLCSTYNILGYDHTGTHLIDVGKPDAIEKAEKIFI